MKIPTLAGVSLLLANLIGTPASAKPAFKTAPPAPPAPAVKFTAERLATETAWLAAHQPLADLPKSRAPATQAGFDFSAVTAEYHALVAEILAIRSPDEIDRLIGRLEQKYDSLDIHSRWIALHLIGLKNLRGIVFRVAPIYQKNHVVLSSTLRLLKSAQEEISTECPAAHCQAFTDYLLYPRAIPADRFFDMHSLTDYATGTIVTDLRAMSDRLRDLASRVAGSAVLADARLLRGSIGIVDSGAGTTAPYHRLVTSAAIYGEIAAIYASVIPGILVLNSYNLDDLPGVFAALGKLYGTDGFFFDPTDGVTFEQRAKVLRGFGNFLTIRNKAEPQMQSAYLYLKSGMAYWGASLKQMKAQLDSGTKSEGQLVRPEEFWVVPERTELAFKNENDLVNGPAALRSFLTGEMIQVNVPNFYQSPARDLKAFLPTSFDNTPVKSDRAIAGGGIIKNSWNLTAGMGRGWNASLYNTYFPGALPARSPRDLVRILRESVGGRVLATILRFATY